MVMPIESNAYMISYIKKFLIFNIFLRDNLVAIYTVKNASNIYKAVFLITPSFIDNKIKDDAFINMIITGKKGCKYILLRKKIKLLNMKNERRKNKNTYL